MTGGGGGLAWQTDVWNRMASTYVREIDPRFAPVVAAALDWADLRAGDSVLDLGSGTGAVALAAAPIVGPGGNVVAVDISPEMLAFAQRRATEAGEGRVEFRQGRGEEIPAGEAEFDALVASLSMMYVIDRSAAARECARVLKPSGRFVAAVWAGPDAADIVRFQTIAGRFAPAPPVPGVGPGALADPASFVEQLGAAGIDARVQVETTTFDFPNLDAAWDVLAGVTAASLPPERIAEAKVAIREEMWPDTASSRTFVNATLLIVGLRRPTEPGPV